MAQEKHMIEVKTPTETFIMQGRPCELSAFSYIPGCRSVPKERTIYNAEKKERYSRSVYDRLFMKDFGYNQYLHRDDREHIDARGLSVNDEERCRVVPMLNSSLYGYRLPNDLDPVDRKYGRAEIIKTAFYRVNGVNLKPEDEANRVQK